MSNPPSMEHGAGNDDDIYAVPKLYCTICLHDLNHPIYLQCSHPILAVPLCVICLDSIENSDLFSDGVDVSDICSWCGDGGDLFMCSNEASCNRSFCTSCVENNFSPKTLQSIENSDEWLCFCCNTVPLRPFIAASNAAQNISIYNQPFEASSEPRGEQDHAQPTEAELEIQRNLYLLKSVVEEGTEASRNLEKEAINSRLAEIRTELRETSVDPTVSVHTQALEEVQLWKAHWERHFDILQMQEAALFELLYSLGCDPRQFPEYNASYETLTSTLTGPERMDILSAERALNSNNNLPTSSSTSSGGGGSSNDGSGSSAYTTVPYVEEVVEVDVNNLLPGYELTAKTDPIVLQYASAGRADTNGDGTDATTTAYPLIPAERYPRSFAAVVPASVLHAYFYASQKQRRELSTTYSIPPHISIIMRHLSLHTHKEFPRNTDRWSFAKTVHPAVRLALHYSESAPETAILGEHYKLNEEVCRVTQFGSTDEVMGMYNSTIQARNSYTSKHIRESSSAGSIGSTSNLGASLERARFNIREVCDAEECEEERDSSVLDEFIRVTNNTSSNNNTTNTTNNTSSSVRTAKVRSLLTPLVESDLADEDKCQRDRVKFVNTTMRSVRNRYSKSNSAGNSRGSSGSSGGDSRYRQDSGDSSDSSDDNVADTNNSTTRTSTNIESKTTNPAFVYNYADDMNTNDIPTDTMYPDSTDDMDGDSVTTNNMTNSTSITNTTNEATVHGKKKRKRPHKELRWKLRAEAEAAAALRGGSGSAGNSTPAHATSPPTTSPTMLSNMVDLSEDSQLEPPIDTTNTNTGTSNHSTSTTTTPARSELKDIADAMEMSLHDAYPTPTTSPAIASKTINSTASVHGGSAMGKSSADIIDLCDSDDEQPATAHTTNNTMPVKPAASFIPKQPVRAHTTGSNTTSSTTGSQYKPSTITTTHTNNPTTNTMNRSNTTNTIKSEPPLAPIFNATPNKRATLQHLTLSSDESEATDSDIEGAEHDPKRPKLNNNAASIKTLTKRGRPIGSTKNSKSNSGSGGMVWEKETLLAKAEEKKRMRALASHKHFKDDGFVLNENRPDGDPAIRVIEEFEGKLKTHQKEGLRFMWDNVMGSVSGAAKDTTSGSGCILAHCMGLGKTLAVIAFTATLLNHPAIVKIVDPYQPCSDTDKRCVVVPSTSGESSKSQGSGVSAGGSVSVSGDSSTSLLNDSAKPTSSAVFSESLQSDESSAVFPDLTDDSQPLLPPPPVPTLPVGATLLTALPTTLHKPPLHPTSTPNTTNTTIAITTTHHLLPTKPLIHTILIIAPKNTLDNWLDEYRRWVPKELHTYTNVTSIITAPNSKESWSDRIVKLRNWYTSGGVMVMGYEMYRLLTKIPENSKESKIGGPGRKSSKTTTTTTSSTTSTTAVNTTSTTTTNTTTNATTTTLTYVTEARLYLQYPGPDIVVADEAHTIKNKDSTISKLVSCIRTKRRIALTGSPLQNNLQEYWCMINFVKPLFLGKFKEYQKYFIAPIVKGSKVDSRSMDRRRMKQRTHLLNKKLIPIVHRRDMSVLEHDLPPKREFVITVKMTPLQKYMYKYFITLLSGLETNKKLLIGYSSLLRVWNHPACAVMYEHKETHKSGNKSKSGGGSGGTGTGSGVSSSANSSSSNLNTALIPVTFPTTTNSALSLLQQAKPKPTLTKIDLLYIRTQLQSTLHHYNTYGSSMSEEMELSASQMEDTMFNKNNNTTSTTNTPSKRAKRRGKKRRGISVAVDDGGDSGSDSDGSTNSTSSNSASDTDSIHDFVVDDDVVEYDSSVEGSEVSADEGSDDRGSGSDGEYVGAKRTRSQRRKKANKRNKRRRRSDSSVEGGDSDVEAENDANAEIVNTSDNSAVDSLHRTSTTDSADTLPLLPTILPNTTANTTTTSSATTTILLSQASTPAGDTVTTDSSDGELDLEEELRGEEGVYNEEVAEALARTTIDADWYKFNPAPTTADNSGTSNSSGVHTNIASDTNCSGLNNSTNTTSAATATSTTITDSTQLLLPTDLSLLQLSNKMVTFLTLLMLSVIEGDKMLVFSQSLYSLDLIELFLNMMHWDRLLDPIYTTSTANQTRYTFSHWQKDTHYLRIDGSSGGRQNTINKFNTLSKFKLLLISTKAGNMGINLQAANRVVIFDTSWNPVHDLQAMYRAYRYGQTKSVFVYRLLSSGSMEEKIYRRQVSKQSLSARVVDAQMPDSHFTDEELMTFEDELAIGSSLDKADQVLQKGAGDAVLSRFIRHFGSELLVSIEDHGGMLEDNIEEHLSLEEQLLAQAELDEELNVDRLPPLSSAGMVMNGAIMVSVESGNSALSTSSHGGPAIGISASTSAVASKVVETLGGAGGAGSASNSAVGVMGQGLLSDEVNVSGSGNSGGSSGSDISVAAPTATTVPIPANRSTIGANSISGASHGTTSTIQSVPSDYKAIHHKYVSNTAPAATTPYSTAAAIATASPSAIQANPALQQYISHKRQHDMISSVAVPNPTIQTTNTANATTVTTVKPTVTSNSTVSASRTSGTSTTISRVSISGTSKSSSISNGCNSTTTEKEHPIDQAERKVQSKVDNIIVLARETVQDSNFTNTPALLLKLVNVQYTVQEVKDRYDYLLRTGKADEIKSKPAMKDAIERGREANRKNKNNN